MTAILPVKSWQRAILKRLLIIPLFRPVFLTNALLRLHSHYWNIESNVHLDPGQWYILISNHRSAIDILVLGYIFNSKTAPINFL